ncbi:MAG: hypothetical protein U0174_13820 [Polyangiaceae bacterium]
MLRSSLLGWLALSLGIGVLACSNTSIGTSSGEPSPDGGAASEGGTSDGSGSLGKAALLALADDSKAGLTGASFDGTSWKKHTFSAGTSAFHEKAVAVANDQSGLALLAADGELPRFALWHGGDSWDALIDVPQASKSCGDPVTAIFRAGLYVIAYCAQPGSVVFQVFDPKTSQWTAPKAFKGIPNNPGDIKLEPSATGSNEVYIGVQASSSVYGTSFAPTMSASGDVTLSPLTEGYSKFRAPILTDENGEHPTQVGFTKNGHTVEATVFFATPPASHVKGLGGCDYFVPLAVPGGARAMTVLCAGSSTYDKYELTLSGSPLDLTFGKLEQTSIRTLDGATFLRGIADGERFLVGTSDSKAVILRDLAGSPEPFADADSGVVAAIGP